MTLATDAGRPALAPGLYLVATPIGAARDITLRALDILAQADVLVAEDTRSLRHLMEIHDIAVGHRPLISYHDHSGAAVRPRILAWLAEGRTVAYASDAGTPLIADPGFKLAQEAIAENHAIYAAPGPSAVLAALMVAGLPTDRFLFAGFPPPSSGARRRWMTELATVPATLVIYESPRRVCQTLTELCDIMGEERSAALCRELTKRFETVVRDTLAGLAKHCANKDIRGEIVLVIDRARNMAPDEVTIIAAIGAALAQPNATVRAVATDIATAYGLPRRSVYQQILELKRKDGTS